MSDSVPVKLLRLCPFGTAKCLSTSNHYQQTSCLTIVSSPLKQMFTSSSSIMSDKWNVINCCATISYSSFARIRSFPHLLIRSFVHSLILLKSNERLWAIHSDRSRQMSDREQIAQVAPDKWANVSELLRSLMTNEQLWVICSGRSWWMSEWAIRSNIFG